jgi:hypothetical protein
MNSQKDHSQKSQVIKLFKKLLVLKDLAWVFLEVFLTQLL